MDDCSKRGINDDLRETKGKHAKNGEHFAQFLHEKRKMKIFDQILHIKHIVINKMDLWGHRHAQNSRDDNRSKNHDARNAEAPIQSANMSAINKTYAKSYWIWILEKHLLVVLVMDRHVSQKNAFSFILDLSIRCLQKGRQFIDLHSHNSRNNGHIGE